jgi:hypothetical protein
MGNTHAQLDSPIFDTDRLLSVIGGVPLELAEEVGDETDDAMENAPKTGTDNRRTGKKRSARFEPPAKDKGTLIESKDVQRTGLAEATLAYTAPEASIMQSDYWERPILPDEKVPGWEKRQAAKIESAVATLL